MSSGEGTRRAGAQVFRHALIVFLGAGLAGMAVEISVPALADEDSRTTIVETRGKDRTTTVITHDEWDEWDDFNRTILEMQRESISSQEEQAREAQRERRRDEIEKIQQQSTAEHDAYFDAILEDSQAALRAPRGVYYRKPGYSSAEGPGPDAKSVEVGGTAYRYDRGVFWLEQGEDSIVVTAPPGAVVDALPQGATRISSQPVPIWYLFGTFYGKRGGSYEVLKPAAGLTVFYLPDGYGLQTVKGAGLYRFGDVYFKPVFVQGVLAYQVVEP